MCCTTEKYQIPFHQIGFYYIERVLLAQCTYVGHKFILTICPEPITEKLTLNFDKKKTFFHHKSDHEAFSTETQTIFWSTFYYLSENEFYFSKLIIAIFSIYKNVLKYSRKIVSFWMINKDY